MNHQLDIQTRKGIEGEALRIGMQAGSGAALSDRNR